MRKYIILLTTALLLTGCGNAVRSSDLSSAQSTEQAPDETIEATPAPSPSPLPEIPYVEYSDDLFEPGIEAPDEIVSELPDFTQDESLELDNGIYFHKSLPQSTRDLFFEYYMMEPEAVRKAVDDYGALIIVGKDGKYTGGNAGLYYPEERIIAINGSSPSKVAMAVNHEIGHCVDSMVGELVGMPIDEEIYWLGVSNSMEFTNDFFDEYETAGYPSWNSFSSFEFFAETYRYVIEDNTAMMNKAPLCSEYVKRVLEQYFLNHADETE